MLYLTNIVIGLVALLHILFLILEMFFWTKPLGLRVFNQSLEVAKLSSVLAANQGLYNGFLAAGLIWGLCSSNLELSFQVKCFFLYCVVIAGAYGAYSVDKKIFFIQAAPAVLGLLLLYYYK